MPTWLPARPRPPLSETGSRYAALAGLELTAYTRLSSYSVCLYSLHTGSRVHYCARLDNFLFRFEDLFIFI